MIALVLYLLAIPVATIAVQCVEGYTVLRSAAVATLWPLWPLALAGLWVHERFVERPSARH
jgi:hypothetical protein